MAKPRTLADTVSNGGPLADGQIGVAEVSGLQTALDAKANAASLAAVATSGSFNDLGDKPTTIATANDLSGGAAGSIPYQAGTGDTAMLAAGTAGQVLTSAGAGAAPTWTTPSAGALTLLATLTPTAAANVDFLNTFTSSYDNYFIALDGILPSADDKLLIRFATGGSVDSGAQYAEFPGYFNSTATTGNTSAWVTGSNVWSASTKGCNGYINIFNVNSSSQTKSATLFTVYNTLGTQYGALGNSIAYGAANKVSGFRLFWQSGANFSAQGKVRVYGYSNA